MLVPRQSRGLVVLVALESSAVQLEREQENIEHWTHGICQYCCNTTSEPNQPGKPVRTGIRWDLVITFVVIVFLFLAAEKRLCARDWIRKFVQVSELWRSPVLAFALEDFLAEVEE